jgi:hypothetical protein
MALVAMTGSALAGTRGGNRSSSAIGSCQPADDRADTQIADSIRGAMNGRRLGRNVTGYSISCARRIVDSVKDYMRHRPEKQLDRRTAVIAVTTAITESTLNNYTRMFDHDSLGLFQQRASWGSAAKRTDPGVATQAFLRALTTVRWRSGAIGPICQRVQRSAFPGAYAHEVHDAELIVSKLWDSATTPTTVGTTTPAPRTTTAGNPTSRTSTPPATSRNTASPTSGAGTPPATSGTGVPMPATLPASAGSLEAPAASVVPGRSVTISGRGFAAGTAVTVALYSGPRVLATVAADRSGTFSTTVAVPAGLAGAHTVVAGGLGATNGYRYLTIPVTLDTSGATDARAAASLPVTGQPLPQLLAAAALLLACGVVLVHVAGRRPTLGMARRRYGAHRQRRRAARVET